ncbi:MAG: hypothetical protein WBD87_16725 [Candidatus Acidiferrales bacterium]
MNREWCWRKADRHQYGPDSFLQDAWIPKDILKPPDLYPLTIEWPDELFQRPEESAWIEGEAVRVPFFDVGIDPVDPAPSSPLCQTVRPDLLPNRVKVSLAEIRVDHGVGV